MSKSKSARLFSAGTWRQKNVQRGSNSFFQLAGCNRSRADFLCSEGSAHTQEVSTSPVAKDIQVCAKTSRSFACIFIVHLLPPNTHIHTRTHTYTCTHTHTHTQTHAHHANAHHCISTCSFILGHLSDIMKEMKKGRGDNPLDGLILKW